MIPEFGRQIELGIAQVDFAEIRAGLSSFSFKSMTFHTPLVHKVARPFGRIVRKRGLSKDR